MVSPDTVYRQLPEGLSTKVRVPASSANLGPGFDSLGIALGLYDEVVASTTPAGIDVDVVGEAADDVPRDANHLVVRALLAGLAHAGVSAAGLHLKTVNAIPHSRGLGSSASAAVSGLAAASGLVVAAGLGDPISDADLVQLASAFEGHPDNAAASVLGSAVVTWIEPGEHAHYGARRLDVHPAIRATAFVPSTESSTSFTRGLLPDDVPRTDAIFNVSRAALAVVALTSDPSCLFAATDDRLHQPYRAAAMPETARLVAALRARGYAATVSGAGPSVLVLDTRSVDSTTRELAGEQGFRVQQLEIAGGVQIG
ncbi:homoserine kinase [Gordonia sp. w5E2]|uniref:homoserine kinase n=1 Tax=Gordonia sp. w5E2 TaxID=3075837 RepID=UPI002F3EBBBF